MGKGQFCVYLLFLFIKLQDIGEPKVEKKLSKKRNLYYTCFIIKWKNCILKVKCPINK